MFERLFKHGSVTIVKSCIEAIELGDSECPGSNLGATKLWIGLMSGKSFMLHCDNRQEAIDIKTNLERDLACLC